MDGRHATRKGIRRLRWPPYGDPTPAGTETAAGRYAAALWLPSHRDLGAIGG